MKLRLFLATLLVGVYVAASSYAASSKTSPKASASMQQKIKHIEANARAPHPDPKPTIFTEAEVNAYLASDDIVLPNGVQSVKLEGTPGVITGTAQVDFDKVREGINSSNPLLSMFGGVHQVVVVAHAYGEKHTGYVHVDSVSLDGVEVPHFVLELFVDKFLTSRYPQIGIDSQFALPDRIDTAVVGEHQMTVTQK